MLKNDFQTVRREAMEHFFVNGETYIIENDNKIYYCDGKNLHCIYMNDYNNGLHPKILGNWSNDTIFGVHGKPVKLGYSYKSLVA